MKKRIAFILALCLIAAGLCSCKGAEPAGNDRLEVVTTIFPLYDWTMNVLGEKAGDADVTMLLDSGVDLHSFQPSADDIIKISRCDVFLYAGGESDAWVEDALKEATNESMVVIDLLEILGDAAKEEEIIAGMEAEEEEEGEEGPEYDEHVWLSLRNAVTFTDAIQKALSTADPENAAVYQASAAAFTEKLQQLDAEYEEMVRSASFKTVLFGDRFPFRYLVDDYGLEYYAAFAGCSAESEASFETIAFLADKVMSLGLPAVLTLEGTEHNIAETIVSTTGMSVLQILSMDSMQSITAEDVADGATYLAIMEKNLDVLKTALQ